MSREQLSGDQYRLLVEAAPTLVWRAGLDTQCDYFNATWLAFTGRTLEQEADNGWVEGVHPEDTQRCVDIYLSNFERRQAFEMEYRLRRHDGVYRWIFDRGVPFSVDGVFAGYIGSCVDVHERREADQAKTTFLSMLAHELRTPLQPLLVYSDELERLADAGQAASQSLVRRMKRQVTRLRALVERAGHGIDLSRGLAKSLTLHEVDPCRLVDEAIAAQCESGRARNSKAAAMRSGASGTPRPLAADGVQLAQVLDIVLDNALKYSPHGGTITVTTTFAPDNLRIEVSDEGIGVPVADLDRLGTPYFRGSNARSQEYSGMGLGLAVARDIIAAHHGTLTLAPGSPRGTRVTIDLPYHEGAR